MDYSAKLYTLGYQLKGLSNEQLIIFAEELAGLLYEKSPETAGIEINLKLLQLNKI